MPAAHADEQAAKQRADLAKDQPDGEAGHPMAEEAPDQPVEEAPEQPVEEAPEQPVEEAPEQGENEVPSQAVDSEYWRLVVVAGVRMELPSPYPEVLLHEAVSPWRDLRIPVGLAEGTAIAWAWHGSATPRPLTHPLIATLLARHNVRVEAVRITGREGRLFRAELDTMGPQGRQVVDCRPSDGIAIALCQRLPTPILVARPVLEAT
jgi:bifunctional DNase/RNase